MALGQPTSWPKSTKAHNSADDTNAATAAAAPGTSARAARAPAIRPRRGTRRPGGRSAPPRDSGLVGSAEGRRKDGDRSERDRGFGERGRAEGLRARRPGMHERRERDADRGHLEAVGGPTQQNARRRSGEDERCQQKPLDRARRHDPRHGRREERGGREIDGMEAGREPDVLHARHARRFPTEKGEDQRGGGDRNEGARVGERAAQPERHGRGAGEPDECGHRETWDLLRPAPVDPKAGDRGVDRGEEESPAAAASIGRPRAFGTRPAQEAIVEAVEEGLGTWRIECGLSKTQRQAGVRRPYVTPHDGVDEDSPSPRRSLRERDRARPLRRPRRSAVSNRGRPCHHAPLRPRRPRIPNQNRPMPTRSLRTHDSPSVRSRNRGGPRCSSASP